MGHGSYRASDWAKLKESRGINAGSTVNQLFSNQTMDDRYNPKFFETRESCDSDDSPNSTPIIIGLDVTGSMGYLAEEIAKNALNETVTQIYAKQPVTNPHILCAAFGNHYDNAPLQVTQFEADIRVVEQLLDLWIERGGNGYSADTFVWYFAAKHTRIDSFQKRGKKGFLFTLGDDFCSENLNYGTIYKIFNEKARDYTIKELIDMASEQYELFHIITKPLGSSVEEDWKKLMPGRVALVDAKSLAYLPQVIISIMQLSNGKPREEVLEQWEEPMREAVKTAVKDVLPKKSHQGLFHSFKSDGQQAKKWWQF
ncbi:MAG: VWA domain-containing protein [Oscillospiraceae bacterium]|nr:VWA domain-containing protein [Oscillospiraceae bacterium]